jgi:hypothetical protein
LDFKLLVSSLIPFSMKFFLYALDEPTLETIKKQQEDHNMPEE